MDPDGFQPSMSSSVALRRDERPGRSLERRNRGSHRFGAASINAGSKFRKVGIPQGKVAENCDAEVGVATKDDLLRKEKGRPAKSVPSHYLR